MTKGKKNYLQVLLCMEHGTDLGKSAGPRKAPELPVGHSGSFGAASGAFLPQEPTLPHRTAAPPPLATDTRLIRRSTHRNKYFLALSLI